MSRAVRIPITVRGDATPFVRGVQRIAARLGRFERKRRTPAGLVSAGDVYVTRRGFPPQPVRIRECSECPASVIAGRDGRYHCPNCGLDF